MIEGKKPRLFPVASHSLTLHIFAYLFGLVTLFGHPKNEVTSSEAGAKRGPTSRGVPFLLCPLPGGR